MPQLQEIIFMGQAWAEAMLPVGTEAIISITAPGAAAADLNDGWVDVLRVCFDDVDPQEFALEYSERAMSAQDAERIAKFVHAVRNRCSTLVVHCRYGQSRSAGVARAICEAFGLHFPPAHQHYNRHVYRAVAHALVGGSAV